VAQIAASIREFGFVNPILVGVDGGIIAGEGRLRAARTEGMHEVPVIVLEHLSEVQRRALVIADNQLALNAGWDEQMLREQLAALQDQDFNLDLLGFDDQELARQLAEHEAAAGLTDEDEVLGRAHSSGHPARRPLAVGPSQREPAAPGIVRRRNHPNRHHATVVRPATPVTYGD
jgi:ParB-like chromosome segregation protein Spo0J